MDSKQAGDAGDTVDDLPSADDGVSDEAGREVKGGLLSASQLGSAQVLKQSSQLSSSVDPGKVQGFSCNGRL